MSRLSTSGGPGTVAALAAGVMIATHVGGRATRDGLFLSNFDIASLPVMFMVAATFSLVTLLWASGAMARVGPDRLVPVAFAGSGLLLVGEWFLSLRSPELASIALYLHIAALGSFLVSGFWSVINERFDPRTARKQVSRIAGGGTLGGLAGGLVAERVAALATVSTMLPLMGLMHLICALLVGRLCATTREPGSGRRHGPPGAFAGVGLVARNVYLRNVAILVLLTSGGATLLDYVFKARAFAVYDQGPELTRFFALFYTATGLATFGLQTALGRRALETLGLAGTTATLPLITSLGSLPALIMPGLTPMSILKGAEASVRSSLFRSGYELLYTPVAVSEKRAAKSIIDVGVDRLADGLAAAMIFGLVLLPAPMSLQTIIVLALASGVGALVVTRRLQQGYVNALKDRLVDRADDQNGPTPGMGTDSMLMQTIGNLDLNAVLGKAQAVEPEKSPHRPEVSEISQDPVVAALADLRSGDRRRVRRRLKQDLDSVLASQVISLLAWDAVCDRAIVALRVMAGKIVGELTDALLDPQADFAVRRRIPRILAACNSPRAVDGLLQGLEDQRFEVRFQCAAALSRIHGLEPDIAIPNAHIQRIVRKELGVGHRGWRSRRLIDSEEDAQQDDSLLEDRLDLSLTHVFRLLSLVFEREALRVALRGLHTDDPYLRGTALEYLENLLPADIFSSLSRYLPDDAPLPATAERGRRRDPRAELMHSRQSIEINLENLRKKS